MAVQEQTNFIRRYFNNDISNGMLGIGFICPANLPAGFSLNSQIYYSCSIVLNDVPSAGLSAGDIFQSFPCTAPGTDPAGCETFDFPAEVFLFHICLGIHTYEALMASGLLYPKASFHITLESYLDNWMPSLILQLKNTPQEDLAEVYLNIQKFLIHLHRPMLGRANRNHQLIESAKQLLFDGCLSGVSFSEIASSLGLGYENFRKIFKEETGLSPLQYLLDTKFHYAQRLLTEGMSVKETAAAVGYADPYIFSRQFKKYIGNSPSYYKPHA